MGAFHGRLYLGGCMDWRIYYLPYCFVNDIILKDGPKHSRWNYCGSGALLFGAQGEPLPEEICQKTIGLRWVQQFMRGMPYRSR
jgi:hypothetical protein